MLSRLSPRKLKFICNDVSSGIIHAGSLVGLPGPKGQLALRHGLQPAKEIGSDTREPIPSQLGYDLLAGRESKGM